MSAVTVSGVAKTGSSLDVEITISCGGRKPVTLRHRGGAVWPDSPYRDTRKGSMGRVGGAGSIEYHSGARKVSAREETRQLDGAAIPVDPRDQQRPMNLTISMSNT